MKRKGTAAGFLDCARNDEAAVLVSAVRYLVKARLKPGTATKLLKAIDEQTLGRGSIAGDEYIHDMQTARVHDGGEAVWVETCFCAAPLEEERPYWEQYFDLVSVKDAHSRRNCRHENGAEPWACCDCDCTKRLEAKLANGGAPFLEKLRASASGGSARVPRAGESVPLSRTSESRKLLPRPSGKRRFRRLRRIYIS